MILNFMSECLGRYYDPNNFDCGANVTNAVRNRGCHQSAGGHSCVRKSENSLYPATLCWGQAKVLQVDYNKCVQSLLNAMAKKKQA